MTESDQQQSHPTEMVPQVESNEPQTVDAMGEAQKLSTIRNILLGGQDDKYGSRLTELEQKFETARESLADQTKETLSGLEKQISSEFESLTQHITSQVKQEFETYTEKLDAEKKERYTSIEKFVTRLDQLETETNSQLKDIKTQIQGIEKTLQEKISNQVQAIKDDLQAEFDTLSDNIQSKINQQTQSKIERTELAGFFKEFADRFSL